MKLFLCSIYICFQLCTARPNFIILLADDLGIGDVGCFGNSTIRTPNIDELALHGTKLNHHLAAAAVCTPSRAALLTGRYPVRAGMESSGRNKVFFFVAASGGLPQNETTIAKALKQEGYKTALIGKWHLGNDANHRGDYLHHPLSHGFDKFYGLPLSNVKDFGDDGQSVITAYVSNFYKYMFAIIICGITTFCYLYTKKLKLSFVVLILIVILPTLICIFLMNIKLINGILMRDDKVVEQPVRLVGLTQRFVQEAVSFMQDSVSSKKPFFLFVPFVHVHTALFAAERFRGKSAHGAYGDNVEELDWAVGEIFRSVKELNIIDETFIYFSSDNGGHVEEVGINGQREGGHNGKYRGGKTMAGYEGGIRVPSIIVMPARTRSKAILDIPTSQMDIFSTILQTANIAFPNDRVIDGKSLLPFLLKNVDNAKIQHHEVLFHYCGVNIHAATYIPQKGKSVWKIHWTTPRLKPNTTQCEFVCHCYGKFVIHHNPPLLYDLSKDPSEVNNLDCTAKQEYMQIIEKVNKLRQQHKSTVDKVPDQFSFANTIWKPWLQPCCNFPTCSCTEEKYKHIL